MFGYSKPSITLRVAWGKILGLLVGITGYFVFSYMVPDAETAFKFGFLIWYLTLGAVIGLMGIFTSNPVLDMKITWWMRGLMTGAWFNLVLLLFTWDRISQMMLGYFGSQSAFSSPWWLVVEGALFGLMMDFVLTKIAGEGYETVISENRKR